MGIHFVRRETQKMVLIFHQEYTEFLKCTEEEDQKLDKEPLIDRAEFSIAS